MILVSKRDKDGKWRLKRERRRQGCPEEPKMKKAARGSVVITRCRSKSIPTEVVLPPNPDGVTELTINNSPELEVLPESIGDLQNLQLLDISGLPNIKRAVPRSIEKCRHLQKIWAIDTPLEVAFPSMMTLFMPSAPEVVTHYGISNNEWPRLKRAALDRLKEEVSKQFGDDHDVYPYLEQMISNMREK